MVSLLSPSFNPLGSLISSSPFANLVDQVSAQLNAPKYFAGSTVSPPQRTVASASGASDFRATLRPLNPSDVFQSGLMNNINPVGVVWPYTPTIQYSQTVQYTDLQLVHSNTDFPAYTRTPSVNLTVSGKFTVQNSQEGQYALSVLHFLRTVSKSYFGEADALRGTAGLPPPVLVFSAYGDYVFNNLRCVLKSHSYTFDDSVDLVTINVDLSNSSTPAQPQTASGASQVQLPALFTISCELMVVQTPQRMRNTFSFEDFASGALLKRTDGSGGGWI